jgi:hypothetical protein
VHLYVNKVDLLSRHSLACFISVVTAIANYTTRVASTSLSATQRTEALKFLGRYYSIFFTSTYLTSIVDHFIGDIGQPLHVEAYEVGGNDIDVTCSGKSSNLHSVRLSSILYHIDD